MNSRDGPPDPPEPDIYLLRFRTPGLKRKLEKIAERQGRPLRIIIEEALKDYYQHVE